MARRPSLRTVAALAAGLVLGLLAGAAAGLLHAPPAPPDGQVPR